MSQLLHTVLRKLESAYDVAEARAVARRLLEEGPFDLSASQLFTGKDSDLPQEKQILLANILNRLCNNEPLQYILGFEYFCGFRFRVGPGVLIPRPETEDLVEWIVFDNPSIAPLKVLDACTGSGCIAISLAKRLPQAQVTGLDISAEALEYARQNALDNQAEVQWLCQDVAAESEGHQWEVLVSNPPYIAQAERKDMDARVKAFEPDLALFVPDEDVLRFYKLLAQRGRRELVSGGALYVEINQRFGREVCELFTSLGYTRVELRNDRYGNPRMVKALKS